MFLTVSKVIEQYFLRFDSLILINDRARANQSSFGEKVYKTSYQQ